MKIGLRICVNTLRGLREGVPNLLRLLDTYQVQASFFFAVGPDRSGRLFGYDKTPSWRSPASLGSRLVHTLLPSPTMSRQGCEIMRSVAAVGHEIGLLAYDPVTWTDRAAFTDEVWTSRQVKKGVELFESVFQTSPKAIAVPGWQINPHLLREEEALGLLYASDVRGRAAFFPVMQGVESTCPQLPTTLPVLGELLRNNNEVTTENVHEYIYAESQYILPNGHIYSLDAEIEGVEFLQLFEKLIVMWKNYGDGLSSLVGLYETVNREKLSRHQIGWSDEDNPGCYVATQSLAV
ncbi:MAG: deacylase [Candidatus Thiodiazotropha sp. (ex Monitilora ramsayi)]|nr:deacylase [Candidatus Thiodiazotropha sp. (ex Monitilora ramsayi)]